LQLRYRWRWALACLSGQCLQCDRLLHEVGSSAQYVWKQMCEQCDNTMSQCLFAATLQLLHIAHCMLPPSCISSPCPWPGPAAAAAT
jgi:hypothetical protein